MNIRIGAIIVQDAVGDEVQIPAVELVLSERNLRTLLAKLDQPDNTVSRFSDAGMMFFIRSEPNEIHYAARPAGLMDENTELQLAADELQSDEPLYVPENLVSEE